MAQRTGQPWGDAFIVNTPTLDRLGQQLYVEQKQRDAIRQKEAQALDEGMQKEIGKMRSVDMPEAIQDYNKYKQLSIQALTDKSLQNDIQKRNQVLQAAQLAKAQAIQKASQSTELKEQDKQMDMARLTHPDLFSDDYFDKMTARRNTPISQLKNHPTFGDLTNQSTFMYQGGDYNIGSDLQKAIGTPQPRYTETVPVQGGLANQSTVYSFGNMPGQVKQQLLGSFSARKAGRAAAYALDALPPGEYEKTMSEYQKTDPNKLKQIGVSQLEDLTPSQSDNKAEKYASYLAAKYFNNSVPKVEVKNPVVNYEAQANRRLKDQMIMEGVRHGDRESEMKFRDKLKNSSDDEKSSAMDMLYKGIVDDARKGETFKIDEPDGSIKLMNKVTKQMPSIDAKVFAQKDSKGHIRLPDEKYLDSDGNWLPIYYQKDDKGKPVVDKKTGQVQIIHEWSQPVLASVFQSELGAHFLGKKDLPKSLQVSLKPKTEVVIPEVKKTPITVKGHKGMFD